jgi:hypothetical protein
MGADRDVDRDVDRDMVLGLGHEHFSKLIGEKHQYGIKGLSSL